MRSVSEHSENLKVGEERGHTGIQFQKQISLSPPLRCWNSDPGLHTWEAFELHPWLKANNPFKTEAK